MTSASYYKSTDIFTPNNHATVNFVPRPRLENALTDALRTPGKQIVIFGHSGSGKSSLLRHKLLQLYPNHITVQCQASLTWDQILLSAFDQLDAFYMSAKASGTQAIKQRSIEASYGMIKAAVSAQSQKHQQLTLSRVVPPQLTTQRLAQFLGAKDLCLVLEDFHKVHDSERVHLAQSLKVFVDAAAEYPGVKAICLGAVDTARQVVQCDDEMRTRVAEIRVPLMAHEELRQILGNGAEFLNVRFDDGLVYEIARFSAGLASACHQLALNACWAADVGCTSPAQIAITRKHVDHAIQRYIDDSSDSLRSSFNRALKRVRTRTYDNTRLILRALADATEEGLTHNELLQEIHKSEPKYPSGNLTQYLRELRRGSRGALLRHDSDSGRFAFTDPLYHAYARALFGPNEDKRFKPSEVTDVLTQLLNERLREWVRVRVADDRPAE